MNKWLKNHKSDILFLEDMAEVVCRFNLRARGFHDASQEGVVKQALLVKEEAEECVEAFKGDHKGEFLKELCDVFVTASYLDFLLARGAEIHIDINRRYDNQTADSYAYWYRENLINFDGDWKGALREVIQSNKSKLYRFSGDKDKHCEKLMADGRYTGVTWEMSGNYLIFRDDKDKILKGPHYFDPMEHSCFEK